MAKETKKADASEEKSTVPVITNESGAEVNVADLLQQMEKAETGHELTSEYWTIEPGEADRVILMEMTEMNGMGNNAGSVVDAVKMLTSEGVIAICGDKVIVSTAKQLFNKGRKNIPVEITCTGKTKSKSGFSYKDFSIKELLM